jgi:type IV pilus assembly protein PilC
MFALFSKKTPVVPVKEPEKTTVLLHLNADTVPTVSTGTEKPSKELDVSSVYKSAIPESFSKDLADLAELTKNLSQVTAAQTNGLLDVFKEIGPETNTKHTKTQKEHKKTKTSSEKSADTSSKDDPKEPVKKAKLTTQLKVIVEQQKSLLQKIAALGNVPIFDPQKFSQLMAAIPALLAWQKSGAKLPTGPAQTTNVNAARTPVATKETAAEIQKNMGIDLGATVSTKETPLPKIKVDSLKSDIENEGFLESTIQAPVEANGSDGIMPVEIEHKSKAELEKERKQKIAEEKNWAEEVKRREKLLEEKRKEAEKEKSKKKDAATKVTFKMPQKAKGGFLTGLKNNINNFGLGKLKYEFIDNLGVMMDAGLPLIDALKSLETETKIKPYKKILSTVVVAVETGSSLWRAMDATYFFEGQQVSMVKVGEEAGNLVENLRYLSEQSQKQRELKAKVKTAMIYPIIVFVMLTMIVFGLGMFVLPNLIQVILSLGVPLPFITRMIVLFTSVFSEHGAVIAPSVFGGAMFVMILHKYTSFKVVTQWLIMKIPGIGTLINESILSQFGVTMGGLMQAGVPITDALDSLANVTTIVKYQKFYYQLLQQVRLGDSFSTAFRKIKITDKIIPGSMQQLISTGEKSGSLTKIMFKIADIHEKKATDVAEKLPVILEPMLLLFIGSLVGTIALGVLAPIYGIVGNIGKA